MLRVRWMLGVALCLTVATARADESADDAALAASVQELRDSIGVWEVTTEFLAPDGSVAQRVEGSYEFEWVVEDRIVSGRAAIPELDRTSGILFYVSEERKVAEMVAVAADGKLWVMTGPLGGDTRISQEYEMADGRTGQLRFTRYNVRPDGFESKMEYTADGGESWTPGNHQEFRRGD